MSIYGLGDIHISADTKIGNLTPLLSPSFPILKMALYPPPSNFVSWYVDAPLGDNQANFNTISSFFLYR